MEDLCNKVKVVFSFAEKALSPRVVADIVERGIGFEARYVRTDIKSIRSGNCDIKKRLAALRKVDDFHRFELLKTKELDCPSLFILKNTTYDLFRMSFSYADLPEEMFFDDLSKIEGFNFGYIEDYEFNYWQNAEDLTCYDLRKLSHDHLPKKSNGLPFPVERTIIDISNNPCRNIKYPGMEFSISPFMWLNKSYLGSVCPSLLKDKSIFLNEREISENVSCYQFCENLRPTDFDLEKAKQLATKINLNGMAMDGNELIRKAPVDVIQEINHIEVNGEQCREVIVWVGANGKPTNKSKAVRKVVNVFNSKGGRINAYSEDNA